MNEDRVNGEGPAEMSPEQIMQLRTQQMLQALEPTIRAACTIMLRGALASTPPGGPAHLVMSAMAYQVGNLMAQSVQGDLATMMQLRQLFRDSFNEGVRAAKPMHGVMPSGAIPGLEQKG